MRFLPLLLLITPVFGADIHHISMHGQSLCIGSLGTPVQSTTQPFQNKRLSTDGLSMVPLIEGGAPDWVESPGSGMANELTFLNPGWNSVVDNNGCAGGSGYSALKKGTTVYNTWLADMQAAPATAAAAGFAYRYSGAFTIHGETDFNNRVAGDVYAGYLQEWQKDVETDVSAALGNTHVPMLVSQMSTWSAYNASEPLLCTYTACNTQGRGVPLGQLDAARTNLGNIYFLGPKYYLPYADSLHLTGAGYLQLGELAGKAWKRILVEGRYWTGLVPRSITLAGSTITFRAWVPAGVLTLDTTTLPDATYCQGYSTADAATCVANGGVWAVKGFEFYDSSGTSKAYITGVSVASSDTITITLNKTPSGGNQRLRYAFTGAGKFPIEAATAPHGNVRDTDPTTGVTSGAHLYDWLATFDDPIGFSWSLPRGLFPLPSPVSRRMND